MFNISPSNNILIASIIIYTVYRFRYLLGCFCVARHGALAEIWHHRYCTNTRCYECRYRTHDYGTIKFHLQLYLIERVVTTWPVAVVVIATLERFLHQELVLVFKPPTVTPEAPGTS